MINHSIRRFNNKPVRAVWDNDNFLWWYSAVDFIAILVEPNSPRRYWNNVKVKNPELYSFCRQLKLFAKDSKKYLSDFINEEGVRLLLTVIPSKYKKVIQDWIKGLLDPIDEQSKKKAYDFYEDELFFSWLSRVEVRNMFFSYSDTAKCMFGNPKTKVSFEFINALTPEFVEQVKQKKSIE